MAFRAGGDTAAARHGTLAAFLLHDKMSSPDDDGRELAVIRLAKPFASFAIHARVATDGIRVAERSPAAFGFGRREVSPGCFRLDMSVASKAMIRVTQIGQCVQGLCVAVGA